MTTFTEWSWCTLVGHTLSYINTSASKKSSHGLHPVILSLLQVLHIYNIHLHYQSYVSFFPRSQHGFKKIFANCKAHAVFRVSSNGLSVWTVGFSATKIQTPQSFQKHGTHDRKNNSKYRHSKWRCFHQPKYRKPEMEKREREITML